jgi:hypothetical protein
LPACWAGSKVVKAQQASTRPGKDIRTIGSMVKLSD